MNDKRQHRHRGNKGLINAAVRHAKDQLDLDLSPCSSWLRFLEVHYARPHSSSSSGAHEETTEVWFTQDPRHPTIPMVLMQKAACLECGIGAVACQQGLRIMLDYPFTDACMWGPSSLLERVQHRFVNTSQLAQPAAMHKLSISRSDCKAAGARAIHSPPWLECFALSCVLRLLLCWSVSESICWYTGHCYIPGGC